MFKGYSFFFQVIFTCSYFSEAAWFSEYRLYLSILHDKESDIKFLTEEMSLFHMCPIECFLKIKTNLPEIS